jgi:hypothetical protein
MCPVRDVTYVSGRSQTPLRHPGSCFWRLLGLAADVPLRPSRAGKPRRSAIPPPGSRPRGRAQRGPSPTGREFIGEELDLATRPRPRDPAAPGSPGCRQTRCSRRAFAGHLYPGCEGDWLLRSQQERDRGLVAEIVLCGADIRGVLDLISEASSPNQQWLVVNTAREVWRCNAR